MWKTDEADQRDPDWKAMLRRCREDPSEGYLHTVMPAGEVLPFSDAAALTYEYPCTLDKEQEGLHRRLVYSSVYGLPLITPAKPGRLRVQCHRQNAFDAITQGMSHVGYVPNEVGDETRPNVDKVSNQWSHGGMHYECHHAECVVVGTARLYFITEEEYIAHWNAFHAAISPWYICPAQGCKYVFLGEPDALDYYMLHVQGQHIAKLKTGRLEREYARTSKDTTFWGMNPCFQYVELGANYPPCRMAPVAHNTSTLGLPPIDG